MEKLNAAVHLVLSGVEGDVQANCYELKRRGFIPIYALQNVSTFTFVLTLSPKLHSKLAIQHGFPVKSIVNSTDADNTGIVFRSGNIIKRSKIKFEQCWLMHQPEKVVNFICFSFLSRFCVSK
jgi:hypothetical protein